MAAEAWGRAHPCSCLVRGSRGKGCREPGHLVYVSTLCPGCAPWSPGSLLPGLRFCGAPTSSPLPHLQEQGWPAAQKMSRINLCDDFCYQVSGPCLPGPQGWLFLVCPYVGSWGGVKGLSIPGNIPSPSPANSPSEPTEGPELYLPLFIAPLQELSTPSFPPTHSMAGSNPASCHASDSSPALLSSSPVLPPTSHSKLPLGHL